MLARTSKGTHHLMVTEQVGGRLGWGQGRRRDGGYRPAADTLKGDECVRFPGRGDGFTNAPIKGMQLIV